MCSSDLQVYHELKAFGCDVDVYDPWASADEVKHEYDIDLKSSLDCKYDAVVLTVGHNEFKAMDLNTISHSSSIVYDIKYVLDKNGVDGRL